MRKWLTRRKLIVILALTAILLYAAFAVWFPNYPLGPPDKAEATQHIVAWIAEEKSMPGFHQAYPDAARMTSVKQIFVVCDFLPPGVILSPDDRVRRIRATEYDTVFKKFGYHQTDYLTIELKEDKENTFTLQVFNVSGPLAGHQYRFVVYRKVFGLRMDGEFIMSY